MNLPKEEFVTGFSPQGGVLPWQRAYILCSLLLLFGIILDDKKMQLRNLILIMKTSQVNVIIREIVLIANSYGFPNMVSKLWSWSRKFEEGLFWANKITMSILKNEGERSQIIS